jgi:predicted RNA-binding Zn-ribbon protein involved in translation (DUF1610 family)
MLDKLKTLIEEGYDIAWETFRVNHTCPHCGALLPRLPSMFLLRHEGYQCNCAAMTWKLAG